MTERQAPSVWVGEEEMSSALLSLCKSRPVAASKVKVAAKIALKYSNDYKMAVHSIEGFIRKANPADKLCGVYVLDAICRQPKSQMFRERFAIRLKETVILVNENVSPQDKPSFVRLLEEWDRKTLFESSTDKFADLALSTGSGENSGSKNSSSSSQIYTPTSLIASSYSTIPKGTTPAAQASKSSSSSAATIDPRKRKHGTSSSSSAVDSSSASVTGDAAESADSGAAKKVLEGTSNVISGPNFFIHDISTVGSRAALYVKMCPFADNCVFGDRCRCSHSDVLGFQPSYYFVPSVSKIKRASFTSLGSCRQEERIPLSAMTTKLIVSVTLQ